MPSVTITSENLEQEGPILDVQFMISLELEKKYRELGKSIPQPIIVKAMTDTGSSACLLQKEIPEKLQLEPIGITKITTPSHEHYECYQYFMRMIIPSHDFFYEGLFVTSVLDGQGISGLIGRDVLKNGILIYIGYMNQFTLSLL